MVVGRRKKAKRVRVSLPRKERSHFRRAKELGKARCEVFDDSMRQRAVERLGTFEQLWPGLLEQMFTERIPFEGDIESIADKAAAGIKTLIEFEL